MLIELRIRHFAIIESLTLPLAPGLNVLSGETGAGKSIIVDALGLLLGERANADVIRTGAEKATVEGVFEVEDRPAFAATLDTYGIEVDESHVVLKREVSGAAGSGRGRAWVNGTPVTASVLAIIGQQLVNVHGQHEAQTLLDRESQRDILDAFAGARQYAEAVREAHEAWLALGGQMRDLAARRAAAAQQVDYWRHVAEEIAAANLATGEEARLDDEAHRLTHAAELRALAGQLGAALDGGSHAVLAQLGAAQRSLAALARIDASLGKWQEGFDTGYYALEELGRVVGEYARSVDVDPERLSEVQQRRDLVFRLFKKYGGTIESVLATGERARAEVSLVDSGELDTQELKRQADAARMLLMEKSAKLTAARAKAAKRLARDVDALLPELGMPDGHFTVALDPFDAPRALGAEEVEFRVAVNVGHEARPLARAASGGELSRVMLALKTILARVDHVPTLVFDEVDAGIGGRVGQQVGDLLRRVSEAHQVFAISHLPQIAARATHHILVSKNASGGVTTADIRVLGGDDRVQEIARMLGGDPERAVSRAHAKELLAGAS